MQVLSHTPTVILRKKGRKRRLLLYLSTSSQARPTGGGRTRILSAAKQAGRHGFQVILVCFVRPDQLTPISQLLPARASLERESGAKVIYLPRLPWIGNPLFGWLNTYYCSLSTALICRHYGIDLVHAHGVAASYYALSARFMRHDLRVIADIHGVAVEEYMYEQSLSRPDKVAERMSYKEQKVLQQADWLVFVSRAMQEHFENKHNTRFHRSSVVPCAVDTGSEDQPTDRDEVRKEYALRDKIVFTYVGSGEAYQLPAEMCRLFATVLSVFPNAFFLILSHDKDVFAYHLRTANIPPTHYRLEAVDHENVFRVLRAGDIGLLLRDESIVNRVASPTKFAEYCLSGLPVITTGFVGDFSKMVADHRLGLVIDLPNCGTLDRRLTEFIRSVQVDRNQWAHRCSQFARDNLSWQKYGHVLAAIYERLGG